MVEKPFRRSSRRVALEALHDFMPRAGADYTSRRNFDHGPAQHLHVSMLSPYIRHRVIHDAEVLDATLDVHGASGASKFIEEIFWRSYFKGWLEQHPTVWSDYRATVSGLIESLDSNGDLRSRYEAATGASTGIDCFDAWVSELVSTGYLHNHARMWFASIWVYTLRLPWQLGADFFYRHLVDGDPASNTLSWRWVCGLHTKGKTYLARVSNIVSYTGGRFDPGGQLAHEAPPLREARIHSRRPLPATEKIPARASFGLLITEENCSLETVEMDRPPIAVMGAVTTNSRSPLPVGFPAREFAMGAVADAVDRAARKYGIPAQGVRSEDWEAALVAWARSNGLDTIVTAYAPVGPVAERLARARHSLAGHGVELVQVMQSYDTCVWPHAAGGFFKLKSRIPELLRELGLVGADDKSRRIAG